MTYFTSFGFPDVGDAGWVVVAGRSHGLERIMVVGGRLPAGDHGPMHIHAGDEILRILDGEVVVRVGDERRLCRAGDVVAIPPNTLHGFRVRTETVLEVIAEHDIGTFFPVRAPDGSRRFVEVYRRQIPWSAPPPEPGRYTTEEDLAEIMAAIDIEV